MYLHGSTAQTLTLSLVVISSPSSLLLHTPPPPPNSLTEHSKGLLRSSRSPQRTLQALTPPPKASMGLIAASWVVPEPCRRRLILLQHPGDSPSIGTAPWSSSSVFPWCLWPDLVKSDQIWSVSCWKISFFESDLAVSCCKIVSLMYPDCPCWTVSWSHLADLVTESISFWTIDCFSNSH